MYDTLGVPRNASQDDIKKAYKKLVLIHHPDKSGSVEKFRKIQNAYEVLSDPNKRREYDNPYESEDESMPTPRGVKKSDYEHTFNISLEDSYRGVTKTLNIGLTKYCFKCKPLCYKCGGEGSIRINVGIIMFNHTCDVCRGHETPSTGCIACEYKGSRIDYIQHVVRIPAGVENGHNIVHAGIGEQPTKEIDSPGDMIFKINVKHCTEFTRVGKDFIWSRQISFEHSVHGLDITIPHYDGIIEVDTSQWGVLDPREYYVIKGKGFVPSGCLKVNFLIVYPEIGHKYELLDRS